MYNVLLVDDEREIRQGLRLKADWPGLKLRIAGEAANGREAVEALEAGAFDLMLTDMKMPAMDGMSLLEYCSRHYPAMRIIVITGYDSFQYAKAAIKNNVRDYLLKPVSQDELTEALRKIAAEMDAERERQFRHREMDWQIARYLQEMRNQFILNVVKSYAEDERWLLERARLLQLEAYTGALGPVRFLAAGLKDAHGQGTASPDFDLPFELICRELAQQFPDQPPVYRDPAQPHLIHFILRGGEDAAAALIAELEQAIQGNLPFRLVVGVGQPAGNLPEWRESYLSAVFGWNMKGSGMPSSGWEGEPASGSSAVIAEEEARLLQRHLLRGERREFEHLVEKELARVYPVSRLQGIKRIFQLIVLIESAAASLGIPSDNLNHVWTNPSWIWDIATGEQAAAFLFRLTDPLFREMQAEPDQADQSVVHAMKDWIDRQYMYDLTLSELADQFHYNSSYLSDLFKNRTGQSFIQYLTEVRMDKAVELLKNTALGLSDIAELTGFSNASYFSSKFKKVFGTSPSEYRKATGP